MYEKQRSLSLTVRSVGSSSKPLGYPLGADLVRSFSLQFNFIWTVSLSFPTEGVIEPSICPRGSAQLRRDLF